MIVLTVDILGTFQAKTQNLIHTNDASFQNDGLVSVSKAISIGFLIFIIKECYFDIFFTKLC